jgi:hypothetical protein
MLFAKFEIARFLSGLGLIKEQLQVDGVTKLKVGCSGSKLNQSLDATLEKVIKVDSCIDNTHTLVTIKKNI